MFNNIVKFSGAAALVLAAQISFAQVNLGVKSTTNASTKVNTGAVTKTVNKTTTAAGNASMATRQKVKEVRTTSTNAVRAGADNAGSTAGGVNANAGVQASGSTSGSASGNNTSANASSQNNADVNAGVSADASGVTDKAHQVKTKTKEGVDGTKSKAKGTVDGTKVKLKEKPTINAQGEADTKVKVKTGNN